MCPERIVVNAVVSFEAHPDYSSDRAIKNVKQKIRLESMNNAILIRFITKWIIVTI